MSVVLLGITPLPAQNNQARSLVQEADDLVMLTREQVSQWIKLRPAQLYRGASAPHTPTASTDMTQLGRQFGEAWVESNPGRVSEAVMGKPRIPPEVDRELLNYGSAETSGPPTDAQRRSLRDGFWAALGVDKTT